MAVSLAKNPLPLPTPEILDWIRRNMDPELYCPWLRRSWPGYGLVGLTFPTGYRPEQSTRINRFCWTSGASRWAFGHFFSDAETTEKIATAAFGQDGTQSNAITFSASTPVVSSDPQSDPAEVLSAKVYLLPPVPLSGVPSPGDGSINNAFLLTVVDQRFYWWYQATSQLSFVDTTTWTQAIGIVNTALGISITADTVDPAYLGASPQLNLSYEVLPPWFDAVAANVGQRVVVNYDGTVATQNFTPAQQSLRSDGDNHTSRAIRAGGDRFQSAIF